MSDQTPIDARKRFGDEITAAAGGLEAASVAIQRSGPYLQQFVKYGKPKWLGERDREALSKLYNIDLGYLIPPEKQLDAPDDEIVADVPGRPPRPGDPIKDDREARIVHAWRKLSKEDQDMFIQMMNAILLRSRLQPIDN